MLKLLLLIGLIGSLVSESLGQNACSALSIPAPYTTPISVFGSTEGLLNSQSNECSSATSGVVWYLLNPIVGATVNLTTCNSYTNFDTTISVATGSCSSFTCILFNDDSCENYSGYSSTVSFVASAETYYVAVGGFGSASGKFELTVSESNGTNQGGCSEAITIPGPYDNTIIFGSTVGQSTGSLNSACGITSSAPTVWYIIEPNLNDNLVVSTCSLATNFDTKIAVLSGSCSSIDCQYFSDDNCSANGNSYASGLTFIATLPQYYIAVTGYGTAQGNYELIINSTVPGDNGCTNAIALNFATSGSQVFSGSTVGHPPVSSTIPPCSTTLAPAYWFAFTFQDSFSVTATTCSASTNFDTKIVLYTGQEDCTDLTCTNYNDDAPCTFGSTQSTLQFSVEEGPVYYLIVTGFTTSSAGDFLLELTLQ